MSMRAVFLACVASVALLEGCGGDDAGGGPYLYEPFNFTQAGLPLTATMVAFTPDAASVPVGMFDIGTYAYNFDTQQWTALDAWGATATGGNGLVRLANGDLVVWQLPTINELRLQRRAAGQTAFVELPPLIVSGSIQIHVRSLLVDREGAFYVAAIRDAALAEPLAIARLPAGGPIGGRLRH